MADDRRFEPRLLATGALAGLATLILSLGALLYSEGSLTPSGEIIWWSTVGGLVTIALMAAALIAWHDRLASVVRGRSGVVMSGAILAALAFAIVVTALAQSSADFQDWINTWAGLATVALVLVTGGYVYFTAGMMRTMDKQLEELRKNRQLQVQPLPYISAATARLLSPTFRVSLGESPDVGPFIALIADIRVQNVGNGPALALDVCPELAYAPGPETPPIVHKFNAVRIDFLQSGDTTRALPMGTADIRVKGFLYEVLLSDQARSPRLRVVLLFKNAPGGRFAVTVELALHFYHSDSERIKEWARIGNTAESRYSALIADYLAQKQLGRERSKSAFDALTRAVKADVGTEDLECVLSVVPEATKVDVWEEAEYTLAVRELSRYASPKWELRKDEIPFE